MRYRATVAYDGTAYHGFQRQAAGIETIQGTLEETIAAITGQGVTVIGAGRTDTGVHASGQVIAFDVAWKHSEDDLLRALNARLPDDIALQDLRRQADFHPRFDAVARVYRYTLFLAHQRQPLVRRRTWYVWGELDGEAMDRAAMLLVGEHDFATFGQPPQGENSVRVVMESAWKRRKTPLGSEWYYTIEANAFLKHMVRRIVGSLVDVGRGMLTVDGFEAAFRSANPGLAGTLAPPQGLVLETVRYRE